LFNGTIILLIIINTIVLALDRHPIKQSEFDTLENMNEALSWFFFAEMIIKLLGLGFIAYG